MALAGAAARATGNPGIDNTAWLFFVLVLAFLFFVTVRGDLPKWLGLLGLGGSPKKSAGSTAPAGTAGAGGGLPGLPALPPKPGFPGLGAQGSTTGGTIY